jgi:hypothetical protein
VETVLTLRAISPAGRLSARMTLAAVAIATLIGCGPGPEHGVGAAAASATRLARRASSLGAAPSSGVELTLESVSDTSGVKHTRNPGIAARTFARGETLRLTLKVANAGLPIWPTAVVNVWAPDHTRPYQESWPSPSVISSGEARYYSFDWMVPWDARTGRYGVSASVRDAFDFTTVYDTFVPGPDTGWGAGDTLPNQFEVVDEPCATGNGGCAAAARCTSSHGARSCVCHEGWHGNGLACAPDDPCATDQGGCSGTAQCVRAADGVACVDNGPGVQLSLHQVSDASGVANTRLPGIPRTRFAPGSTVRLTLRAGNTGPPIDPWTVLALVGPDGHLVWTHSAGAASPLEAGTEQYFSHDWQIPPDALPGSYRVASSIRSASSFSTLYDTLVPGANTSWGPGDTLHDTFTVASGVAVALHQVSDASGAAHSATPGVAQQTFTMGDEVRITLQVTNTGPASTNLRPTVTVWGPGGAVVYRAALGVTVGAGERRFVSFDWELPLGADEGAYALTAALVDGDDPGLAYDLLGPPPGGPGRQFTVTRGAELTLYRVTDATGAADTAHPGRLATTFAPGETVRITLKASNSSSVISPSPRLNIWAPDSSKVFDLAKEAVPLLGSGGVQYYSYDWTIPLGAPGGDYAVSASLREASNFSALHDTLVPGPGTGWGTGDTMRQVFEVVSGVTLMLHAITDATGTMHTSDPGVPNPASTGLTLATFGPGDTVRVTFKAQNSGAPVTPRVVLNLWAPAGTIGRVLDASVAASSPLAAGESRYFSFDWVVPAQPMFGSYSISASVRDAAAFSTVYDTLAPGPNTGWGKDDTLTGALVIAPIARITNPNVATGVSTLTWSAAPGAAAYRLWVGTAPGRADVLDSGPIPDTSHAFEALPDGPLWAQVWTDVGGQWLSSGYVLFTSGPAWTSPELLYPLDGDGQVDPDQPVQWSSGTLALAHRLRIGTSPGRWDLVDSGWIQVPRRFLPALPSGVRLYGLLESRLPDRVETRQFVFRLARPGGASAASQIQNALWATGFVRRMAALDNVPAPYTRLLFEVQEAGRSTALCSQYAAALLDVLAQMNVTLPARKLTIGFNPNYYEMHDLCELEDTDTGAWMVLDPLFGVAPQVTAEGRWATAEDVQDATVRQAWDAITYVELDRLSSSVLKSYYVDYPLLYLNVWHATDQITWGQGRSILPYVELTSDAGDAPRWLVVRAPSPTTVVTDGVPRVLSVEGVDHTSPMFKATVARPSGGGVDLFQVSRFVFR